MDNLNLQTKVDPVDIATEMAHQMDDREVLEFLEQLDEKMGSWDFTQKAASLFVRTGLQLDGEIGEESSAKAALARVQEFLRQLKINPAVQRDDRFYTVWTDPQAKPVDLSVGDLDKLIELAAISLGKEDQS
jgi:hypothetical protein